MEKLSIHKVQERAKQDKDAKSNLRKCKKKEAQAKTLPYPVGDGKTVFYCTSPERGAARVAECQRKLNSYK